VGDQEADNQQNRKERRGDAKKDSDKADCPNGNMWNYDKSWPSNPPAKSLDGTHNLG
jgi:hypothetical protein